MEVVAMVTALAAAIMGVAHTAAVVMVERSVI